MREIRKRKYYFKLTSEDSIVSELFLSLLRNQNSKFILLYVICSIYISDASCFGCILSRVGEIPYTNRYRPVNSCKETSLATVQYRVDRSSERYAKRGLRECSGNDAQESVIRRWMAAVAKQNSNLT